MQVVHARADATDRAEHNREASVRTEKESSEHPTAESTTEEPTGGSDLMKQNKVQTLKVHFESRSGSEQLDEYEFRD